MTLSAQKTHSDQNKDLHNVDILYIYSQLKKKSTFILNLSIFMQDNYLLLRVESSFTKYLANTCMHKFMYAY